MALTKRQFEVLEFLDRFIEQKGYSPSFIEIGKSLNLSSSATIHKHIHMLEKKGFIRIGQNQSRSIEIINRAPILKSKSVGPGKSMPLASGTDRQGPWPEIPLLGLIAEGRPLEAIQNNESVSLKEFAGRDDVFLLKVMGDSMIEDHICEGDYVVVEKTATAGNGDTVVALVGQHEATLKRMFREKDGQVRLQPANASMAPILVRESDLEIQGRVIAVLRKY